MYNNDHTSRLIGLKYMIIKCSMASQLPNRVSRNKANPMLNSSEVWRKNCIKFPKKASFHRKSLVQDVVPGRPNQVPTSTGSSNNYVRLSYLPQCGQGASLESDFSSLAFEGNPR